MFGVDGEREKGSILVRGSSTKRPTVGRRACRDQPGDGPKESARVGKREHERAPLAAPSQSETQGTNMDMPVVASSSDAGFSTKFTTFNLEGGSGLIVIISGGHLN